MTLLKDRLAEAMRRHPNLNQADIARACKVKSPSVTDWLNGKTKSLSAAPARLAARLFRCNQNWIGQGIGLPNWEEELGQTATAVAQPSTAPLDLTGALEVLGIALAATMTDDVRHDVADLLAKLAQRHGAERHQVELLHLLTAKPAKRQANG